MITPDQFVFLGILAIAVTCSWYAGTKFGITHGSAVGMALMVEFIKFKAGEEQVDQWVSNDPVNFELWLRRQGY